MASWAKYVLEHAAARSLVGALVARAIAIRVKARLACETGVGRVEQAVVGLLCRSSDLSAATVWLGRALLLSSACSQLTIIWLNAERDGLESVKVDASAGTRLVVTSERVAECDAIVDLDSFERATTTAELQANLARWIKSAPPGTPVVSVSVRWPRLLAHVERKAARTEDPSSIRVSLVGSRAQVNLGRGWSVELPSMTPALWTSTLGPMGETAVAAKLERASEPKGSAELMALPIEVWRMQAEQQSLHCVFDEALDAAAWAMQERLPGPAQSSERDALHAWNESMDTLGLVQACVWVHDPLRRVGGIWRAAMDAFKTGSSLWPI
jgi:hypothetical protein